VNAPVGSRRELVANSIHTAEADTTQLDSCVASASAVCIGLPTANPATELEALQGEVMLPVAVQVRLNCPLSNVTVLLADRTTPLLSVHS